MAEKSRKLPKQERSKLTVDALLEATTRILIQDGTEGLTTNRVAEVAGVSIGSLYQYFPNKMTLIAALIEKHVAYEVKTLTDLYTSWSKPVDKLLITELIKKFIQIHLEDLQLTKLLHEQVSFAECRSVLRKATKQFEKTIVRMLESHFKSSLPLPYLETKAFVLTNSIDAVVQLSLVENPKRLTDPIFLNELVNMVMQTFSTHTTTKN